MIVGYTVAVRKNEDQQWRVGFWKTSYIGPEASSACAHADAVVTLQSAERMGYHAKVVNVIVPDEELE